MKFFAIGCVWMLAGCGSSAGTSTPSDAGPSSTSSGGGSSGSGAGASGSGSASSGSGSSSSGSSSGGGGVGIDDSGFASADAAASPCDAAAGCGSLEGFVQRTSTAPTHGGKGPVYVAVFQGNPIFDKANAVLVANQLIPDADLSASGAQVAYRIDGVPISTAAYAVLAFLDDANTVTAADPTPASGDLVSLYSGGGTISGYPATIASGAGLSLNLPLNTAMP